MKQRILYILLGLTIGLIAGGALGYTFGSTHGTKDTISSFDECVAAGYPLQDSWPERCSTPDGKSFTRPTTEGQSVSIDGKIVCLPHKDTDGEQTLECAAGLQNDAGDFYILVSPNPSASPGAYSGSEQRVNVTGTLTQEDSIYQNKGTITVSTFKLI